MWGKGRCYVLVTKRDVRLRRTVSWCKQTNYCQLFLSFNGVNPSISRHFVGDTLSEENKPESETCESVKWSKGEKLEDLEEVLVICIEQVNV
jgi:hypothetical protein